MQQQMQNHAAPAAAGAGGPPAAGGAQRLRDAGVHALDAADDAVDRALSQDSAEFLRANRQIGGE